MEGLEEIMEDLNEINAEELKNFPPPPVCSFTDPEKVPCVITWVIYLVFILATVVHILWFYISRRYLNERQPNEQSAARPEAGVK